MQSRKKWKRRYYKERKKRKETDKAVWQTYEDYQNVGKKMFEYLEQVEQLESNNKKLIEKLEEDIVNITKTMQDGKHCDDYSRCRLKAYRTKTKEILKILKGEKE